MALAGHTWNSFLSIGPIELREPKGTEKDNKDFFI